MLEYPTITGYGFNKDAATPARKIYPVIEYEKLSLPLEVLVRNGKLDIYPEVQGKGYFQIHFQGDRPILQAGGFVGFVPINNRVAVDIRPKIPIRNLEELVAASQYGPSVLEYLRLYPREDKPNPSLLVYLAKALLESIEEIKLNGLYRSYEREVVDTSFPKGRILLGNSLQTHFSKGVRHRLLTSQFFHTVDTPLNQCIKYAIWHLSRIFNTQEFDNDVAIIINQLNKAYIMFSSVMLDRNRVFLNHPLVRNPERLPAIRDYYKRSIYLATAIIQDAAFKLDKHGGTLRLPTLLLNLEVIFEDYIRRILSSNIPRLSPYIQVLNGNLTGEGGAKKLLFDVGSTSQSVATPDIVVQYNNPEEEYASSLMIIDTKYKAIDNLTDRKDLNQIVTYTASYRAPIGVLVYPNSNGTQGLDYMGHIDTKDYYRYFFDLSTESLASEEELLIQNMLQLVQ